MSALTIGSKVKITKGCNARSVTKGATAVIKAVEPLGAEYGHQVKVSLYFLNSFASGKTMAFYARHPNRLADPEVRLNDGNPSHTVVVRPA